LKRAAINRLRLQCSRGVRLSPQGQLIVDSGSLAANGHCLPVTDSW
jgi:hypothetical protein